MRWLPMLLSLVSLFPIACSTRPLSHGDAGDPLRDLGIGGNGGGTEMRADGGGGGNTGAGLSSTNSGTTGGDPGTGVSGSTIPSSTGGMIFVAGQQTTTTALTGGTTVIGTPPATGGAGRIASGGSNLGGATIMGGRSTGGVSSTGGSLGAGGTTALGGRSSGGGSATGGGLGAAGTTALGGGTASGGAGGTSKSSSASLPPNGEVTFSSGMARGFLKGYGWVALGLQETLSSPTCDGAPITSTEPCNGTTRWSRPDALCISGGILALPATPTQADYDNNWGMHVAVNVAEPNDAFGEVMSAFTTVAFIFSGIPSTGVRAFVHRKGDHQWTTYCFDSIKSGKAVSLTKFNTKCWGEADTAFLDASDLPEIDQIGLRIPSQTSPITVSNLCLEKISFM